MESIKSKIEYHKSKLKELTQKLNEAKDVENEKSINYKIKLHQEFLDSLYTILKEVNSNNKENNNDNEDQKETEKQPSIKSKNNKENENSKVIKLEKKIVIKLKNKKRKLFLNH